MVKKSFSRKYVKKSRRSNYRRKKMVMYKSVGSVFKSHLIKRPGNPLQLSYIGNGTSLTFSTSSGINASDSNAASGFLDCYDVAGSFNIALQNCTNYTDITNMYQKYKIVGIKLKMFLDSNVDSQGAYQVLPRITYRVNTNTSEITQTGTSVDITDEYLLQSPYTKVKRFDKGISVYFKPRAQTLMELQSGGNANAGIVSSRNQWITTTTPGVVHHGFQFVISNWYANLNSQTMIRVQPTYYIAVKDTF